MLSVYLIQDRKDTPVAFHFAQKRKGRARERWKRKGECEFAPLPSVSYAYSSVGTSQFPSARILFAHVALAAVRNLGKQVQIPLGNLASLNPFSFLA